MSWLGITSAGPDEDNNPNDAANWPQPAPSEAPWGWSVDPEDPAKVVITDAQYEPVIYGECVNPCDLPLLTAAPELLAALDALRVAAGDGTMRDHAPHWQCALCDALRLTRAAIAKARGEVPS